jgi:hypothetical protein
MIVLVLHECIAPLSVISQVRLIMCCPMLCCWTEAWAAIQDSLQGTGWDLLYALLICSMLCCCRSIFDDLNSLYPLPHMSDVIDT